MYFIRNIKKTKKKLDKSSFIISLPKKLQRKIESQNKEIENRLANFSRFRYFYDVTEGSRCFLLSLWSNELPPNSVHDKTVTTTIQKSGRSSRYVLIPKKVCNRYGWGMGTELVIGFDYQLDEFMHGIIYKNNDFVTDKKQPQACVIKFQRYQDMKDLYRKRLASKKIALAREESNAYWNTRNRTFNYDVIMDRIRYARKHIHRLVWNRLLQMNLVALSYSDFVKIRAEKERDRKKKRRQFLQKRYGNRTTWSYRKDFVKRGRKYGYDYDSYYENKLDDPDSYLENRLDNPDSYHEDKLDNQDD